jgi:hypothetical protein
MLAAPLAGWVEGLGAVRQWRPPFHSRGAAIVEAAFTEVGTAFVAQPKPWTC